MNAIYYSFLHVTSAFLLVALTFAAFANPAPEARKRTLALTGILSLVMLVGGFGLVARVLGGAWPAWVFVKIACWLVLSALAGLAYRKPERTGVLRWVAVAVVVTALAMVYLVHGTPSA